MLYLRNTTDLQYVVFPLERWNAYDILDEDQRVGAGRVRAMFDGRYINVTDDGDAVASDLGHYIRLGMQLPEGIANGSYEMTLEFFSPASLVGSQSYVVQVGDYVAATTEYEKTIEYEQFR